MADLFKPAEVLKLAVRIEENGREYYEGAKEKASGAKVADIFGFLAGEEVRHLAIFRDMLAAAGEEKFVESYPGEHDSYVRALAESCVFTKDGAGKERLARARDEEEVIWFAIGFEKDSILLYYEMLELVPPRKRGVVEEVIREEKSHVRKLKEIRAGL